MKRARAYGLVDIFDEWQILGMVKFEQGPADHVLWQVSEVLHHFEIAVRKVARGCVAGCEF